MLKHEANQSAGCPLTEVKAVFLTVSADGEKKVLGGKYFFRTNVLTSGYSPSSYNRQY
jgi:hypothetical protein